MFCDNKEDTPSRAWCFTCLFFPFTPRLWSFVSILKSKKREKRERKKDLSANCRSAAWTDCTRRGKHLHSHKLFNHAWNYVTLRISQEVCEHSIFLAQGNDLPIYPITLHHCTFEPKSFDALWDRQAQRKIYSSILKEHGVIGGVQILDVGFLDGSIHDILRKAEHINPRTHPYPHIHNSKPWQAQQSSRSEILEKKMNKLTPHGRADIPGEHGNTLPEHLSQNKLMAEGQKLLQVHHTRNESQLQ